MSTAPSSTSCLTAAIPPVDAAAFSALTRVSTSAVSPAITRGAASARSTDSASPIVTKAQLVFWPFLTRWRIVARTYGPNTSKISSSASSLSYTPLPSSVPSQPSTATQRRTVKTQPSEKDRQ